MKKPASKRQKLILKRQTIRTLSGDDLSRIAGGNDVPFPTEGCSVLVCSALDGQQS